ncbi:hypothetical protein [Aphanizomenon flos-aquae]|uniref:hypothetical protein n=1 Tax=Aphanizomenon flos-aquae TaxID=1176 RepID=UPI000A69BFA4|nr:hypothetical protein [Aphanizomenon flos-aquae]
MHKKILTLENITDDTILTIEDMKNLVKNKIFPQSSTGESSHTKINKFINSIKKQDPQQCSVQDVCSKNINVKGINYSNWQKFYQGKPIPENTFNAFCQVLDLEPDQIAYKPDNTTELEDKLKLFNHEIQIDVLSRYVNQHKNAFLISNNCLYSRCWMLHRLKKAIETCFNENKINKCSVIPLNGFSQYIHTPLTNIIAEFKSKFHQHKIYEKLKREHIIIVINIDHYCCDIKNIQEIYDNFYKIMYEARSPDNLGHLLMFLLATDKNLQNQLQNQSYIHENIIELPNADYRPYHLINLLNMEELMANEIINKCQNNAQELLVELYKYLNIDRNLTTLKIWSNYPWN